MSSLITCFYRFGDFAVDMDQRVLLRQHKPVPLTPKVFETLLILIAQHGRIVGKDELMNRLWPDSFVEEANLTFNIQQLRKALGDHARQPVYIETVARRGYRFIAEVEEVLSETGVIPGRISVRHDNLELSAENELAAGSESQPSADVLSERAVRPPAQPPVMWHLTARRYLVWSSVSVILIGSLAAVAFVGIWYAGGKNNELSAPILSTPFASEKLSTNGKVRLAVISPDGKNVVYTNGIEGKQSVWLRQLDTANNVEIIPPSDDFYYGLALSPDGNFLYFVRAPKSVARQFDIYRVSIFGGIPTKISGDADGWISISPDGAKISFVRCYYRDDDFCSLWIADASDGKNEKKLVSRQRPFRIADNEISPDGKRIAFAVGQSENGANEFGLVEVDIASGVERELTAQKFYNIRGLTWLPDQSSLFLTASRISTKHFRIWQVSADSGEVSPLTKDSESYSTLSLDKEANRLVSTQVKEDFRLYLYNTENSAPPRVLADGTRAAFAPNGKIVFNSLMTGNDEIWSINPDGSERRQLTNNPADDGLPVVSPDSNSIFFASNRTGAAHVWRMNADGSNQVQITQKEGGFPLSVSPDGKWLYYHHGLNRTLWRVPTDGGEEQLVFNKRKNLFAVSPDGLQIAFLEKQGAENILMIISLADAQTVKTFKLADERAKLIDLKWSQDGEHLAYILAVSEFENKTLWFQPLNGETPRQIANLGDERIAASGFALAPDGKSFAVVQGGWRHDAVLLTDLR